MKTNIRQSSGTLRARSLILISLLSLTLVGCASFATRSYRQASSVVDYLYPKDRNPQVQPSIPVLKLPLTVGIAWVPEPKEERGYRDPEPLSEYQKQMLIGQIVPQFETNSFVQSITSIPQIYLKPEGGFENLDQLRSVFGVDVIALVSYDQVQFSDESLLSLTYLTVLGGYIVEGEKNDTQTMIDVTVFDIPSRKLLFRAPGSSRIKAASTQVGLTQSLRVDSVSGFDQASTNLVANLEAELDRFKARLKERPAEIQIERKPGYTGMGGLGVFELILGSVGVILFCRSGRGSRR